MYPNRCNPACSRTPEAGHLKGFGVLTGRQVPANEPGGYGHLEGRGDRYHKQEKASKEREGKQ